MIDIHWHPVLVHFPVALFTSAFVLELISLGLKKENLHKSAVHIYTFAAVVTPLVVLTGWLEADRLHLHHAILYAHRNFAFLTSGISLIGLAVLWFVPKKYPLQFQIVFFILAFLTAGCVAAAGYYGGMMVYEYGIGVE